MVTVDDKKYACETCIKGHRSSACKHTDRPLFEIKKKGRPITQCEHCRELRKTKQVHVKCSCGSVPSSSGTAHEGSSKLPHAATFPNGLPKELEAKVGSPVLHSDGSESEFSGDQSSVSACKCGPNQCHCCVPRKSVSKRRMSGTSRVDHPQAAADLLSPVSPLSSHVQARIAELRPVMPRPPRQTSGPLHNPSAGTPHGYGGRNHAHDFSPYGRAYEQSFSETPSNPAPSSAQVPFPPNVDPQLFTNASDQLPPQIAFPSACTCGDGCQCPGCTQHSKSPAPSGAAFSSCCNPITCSFCLDCTIFSMPPEALLEPSQTREIDTWLQQLPLSSPNSFSPTSQI
ncbi:copper-fist-domain-containing protein, partial [Coniophora puteana RWD-64-598 SS2]